MQTENISKPTRTSQAKIVIYFSAYTTHKKEQVSIDDWFDIKEEMRHSKELESLLKRT